MIVVRVMKDTRDLFIWDARLLMEEMVTFIRDCSGYACSGRNSIIILLSRKVLYPELRPTMLKLAMVFVANRDCFCSVRYLGCSGICLPVDLLE